jgi:hypothetical protein
MREWVNNVRWQCGLIQLHWVSSCSDPGKVFAQIFGIAGILKGGVTFIGSCAAPQAPKGTTHILQMVRLACNRSSPPQAVVGLFQSGTDRSSRTSSLARNSMFLPNRSF